MMVRRVISTKRSSCAKAHGIKGHGMFGVMETRVKCLEQAEPGKGPDRVGGA